MTALTIVLTVLTALVFLAAARVKFVEEEHAMETRDRLAIRPAAYGLIGGLEVAGAVGALIGLAFRPLGIVSLTGLVLVALGACAANVKLHNPPNAARPAVLALLLAASALALQIATA
jgi:DoxX-like family